MSVRGQMCSNCRHWQDVGAEDGACLYPLPPLPDCISRRLWLVTWDDGARCPCWQNKVLKTPLKAPKKANKAKGASDKARICINPRKPRKSQQGNK